MGVTGRVSWAKCVAIITGFLVGGLVPLQNGQAQEVMVPLGDATEFVCAEDEFGPFLQEIFDGELFDIRFRRARRIVRRRRRVRARRARRLERRGFFDEAAELRNAVALDRMILTQIGQCRRGQITGGEVPVTPGPAPEPTPAPPSPTPPSTPTTAACTAAGGTARLTRIINGDDCNAGSSPVVELAIGGGSCSGTVIHPRAVLSAAHCFFGNGDTPQFGLDVQIFTGNGTVFGSSYTVHPGYDGFNADFDLAVVITDSVIPTAVAPYVRSNDIITGERAVIAGYGIDEFGVSDGTLRAGFMDISGTIGNLSIQAIYDGTLSDTCSGDSGGPILVFRNGAWTVAGTTSFGTNADCRPVDEAHFGHLGNASAQEFIANSLP